MNNEDVDLYWYNEFHIPVWEMDCFSLNVVLSSCIDRDEIASLCFKTACECACDSQLPQDFKYYTHLHRACHDKNILSESFEAFLIDKNCCFFTRFYQLSYNEIISLYANPFRSKYDLKSLIWVLFSDNRGVFGTLKLYLFNRVLSNGVKILNGNIMNYPLAHANGSGTIASRN